jgi:hypothetical protein
LENWFGRYVFTCPDIAWMSLVKRYPQRAKSWRRTSIACSPRRRRKPFCRLLAQLQASEYDKFAAHLYRSRREYRSACQRAGKSGKQIERCALSTFQVAESIGFKGDFRQWKDLLRIAIENCGSLFVQRNSAQVAAA